MMKSIFSYALLLLLPASRSLAQDFITRGKIEYEIKRNNKLMFQSQNQSNEPYAAQMPDFTVWHRDLLFTSNVCLYQKGSGGNESIGNTSENAVYTDINRQKVIRLTTQNSKETYVYEDSVQKVKWKILNETRTVAGFTCRKAIGRIYDSVYVVAFYCPEIVSNAGPELFSGLPGMILGLAIPRYFTTWFATRIEVASLDESKIVPPTVKKVKTYAKEELIPILLKKFKESGWTDATAEAVKEMLSAYTVD